MDGTPLRYVAWSLAKHSESATARQEWRHWEQLRKCSLRACACARVKLLEGFWVCGRVRGDRSVFVCCTVLHTFHARLLPP